MRPPKIIKPYVTSFARNVTGMVDVHLTYIACTPLNRLSDSDCFPFVESHIAEHGGERVIGWVIWERPKVFMEAEFHAVWKAPDGSLHDIVPRRLPIPRILFLCDPRRHYKGVQVNNVRKALTNDKNVKEFIRVFDLSHRLYNEGDLAEYHGPINLLEHPKLYAIEREKAAICQKIDQSYGPWTCETTPTGS